MGSRTILPLTIQNICSIIRTNVRINGGDFVRQYLVIDQKSYFASVECVARGLDPMKADLVVADPDRSRNTICLAVSAHL